MYSPETSSLKRKFGNFLVKYRGLHIEDDQELILLEKAVKIYILNYLDEYEGPKKKKLKEGSLRALMASTAATNTPQKDVLEVLIINVKAGV